MRENIKNTQSVITNMGVVVVYDVYNNFTDQKTYTEFCFAPKQMFWNYFNYNEWLNLINSILCIVLKTPPTGSRGTFTEINLSILNKRIVEPGDKLIGAENIFNSRNQYIHGTVKVMNLTISESGFVTLDVELKLYDELGSARFKIMRK